ncbi:signal peptidase I, partial [Streptomyces anulatus]|uniref:signal peptidase I n=1 Tax=Streptomyces anulatus TaxID=1892 RepID=UPI0034213EF9
SSGTAMEPTIKEGRHFTARMVGEGYVPKIGEVIVYQPPRYWTNPSSQPNAGVRISRIIGVPGSSVSCCDAAGRVVVNGRSLSEPYVSAHPASSLDFKADVPPGRLWIMGDNRDVSLDSRSYRNTAGGGTIAVSDVVGVVDPDGISSTSFRPPQERLLAGCSRVGLTWNEAGA